MPFNPYEAQIAELTQKIENSKALLSDPDFALLAQEEIAELES